MLVLDIDGLQLLRSCELAFEHNSTVVVVTCTTVVDWDGVLHIGPWLRVMRHLRMRQMSRAVCNGRAYSL